jgi:predicted metalloprotease with PDZ domain
MQAPLIYVALAAAAGIGIGVMLGQQSATSESVPVAEGQAEAANAGDGAASRDTAAPAVVLDLTELQRSLQDEIRARRALEKKLDRLVRRVAEMGAAMEASPGTVAADDAATNDSEVAGQGWFDEQALIEGGMDSVQASQLKAFFEQLEMERLYLRDQAAREGWDRARLRDEFRQLDDKEESLRDQLGESAYDAYLYASGQSNRVAVTSVLASAQAGQAGIEAGDHILRYDNQRVYNWRDLRRATTSGDISDVVEVEVDRDGETLQFYLARGPLGIRMDSLSVAP